MKREQVVKVAEKYVAKGRIDAAIKEYLKILKENPNDVSTLNRLGDLYARISAIDDAVRLFTQIATQYTEDGFLVKAIAIYKKVIKLDPTRLQIYESLAALYHKQGLTNEARTQYQVLADYYLKHHDAAAAINIYQRMVELEPDNPSHHLKLAELYQQGQLWDKALRSYRTIAELMLQHGRVDEAVRVYQRAIEVHSDDLGFITDAVLGIKDAGHTGAAARLLASAVAANPQAEKVARLAGLRQGTVPTAGDGRETVPQRDSRETLPPPRARPAPPPPRQAMPPPTAEDDFLVIDIDEPSGSLVQPPADMDQPGSAFRRPSESDLGKPDLAGAAAWDEEQPAPAAPPPPSMWGAATREPSSFSFDLPDLDLSIPDVDSSVQPPDLEPQPQTADDKEAELAWEEAVEETSLDAGAAAAGPVEEEEIELEVARFEPLDEDVPPPPVSLTAAAHEEIELDLDEAELGPMAAPSPTLPSRPAAPAPPPLPAPAPEPPRLQDLLAEAEVFAKYALEEKALERLDQVLERDPTHLEALQLLLDLSIRGGDGHRVEGVVRRLRRAVEERKAPEVWAKAQAKLARAGMSPAGAAAAAPRPSQDDRVSQLLKSLAPEAPAAPAARPEAPRKRGFIDAALDALTSSVREKPARRPGAPRPTPPTAPTGAPPPAAAPPAAPPAMSSAPPGVAPVEPTVAGRPASPVSPPQPAPGLAPPLPPSAPPRAAGPPPSGLPSWPADLPPADERVSLDDAFEEELPDIVLPEERRPSAAPELDDTGMDWLREEPAAAAGEKLFDEEDEFFDLAAELEQELGHEEGPLGSEILSQHEEPSLEEIVEGFKKGVAENLSPEDYDTHYNLGIAYREMGLLDEAVGEFQLAAKDPIHLVDCCSMLGVSFLEKGLPELAVKWYQRGLGAPDIREETTLSLLYDMGNVYLAMGDPAAARKTFVELYGINSNYRDVVAKLEELGR